MPSNPAPDTNLPITLTKKTTEIVTPQDSHPYGTRSKTKLNSMLLDSSSEDEESFGIGSLIGNFIRNINGCNGTNIFHQYCLQINHFIVMWSQFIQLL